MKCINIKFIIIAIVLLNIFISNEVLSSIHDSNNSKSVINENDNCESDACKKVIKLTNDANYISLNITHDNIEEELNNLLEIRDKISKIYNTTSTTAERKFIFRYYNDVDNIMDRKIYEYNENKKINEKNELKNKLYICGSIFLVIIFFILIYKIFNFNIIEWINKNDILFSFIVVLTGIGFVLYFILDNFDNNFIKYAFYTFLLIFLAIFLFLFIFRIILSPVADAIDKTVKIGVDVGKVAGKVVIETAIEKYTEHKYNNDLKIRINNEGKKSKHNVVKSKNDCYSTTCPDCKGLGYISNLITCNVCNGSGFERSHGSRFECSACNGTGATDYKCFKCYGTGTVCD